MYWSISSSPVISSSSTTVLGEEDGVNNDCWLELGDVTVCLWDCEAEELGILAAESETFGDKSLRPFEGDRAENLWWDVLVSAGTLNDVTELVDPFLRPVNDKDSLFAFRVTDATRLEDEEVVDWRGTRDTEPVVDGEARTE